jgi:SAM-dependent methyltransferase
MDSITDRIKRSVAQRGLWGTVQMCAVGVGWKVLPAFRRELARRAAEDAAFDAQYGVDTGGVFRPKREAVIGENWALGVQYRATDPVAFRESLSAVDIHHEDFVFLDIGSGKGRILLLAAEFPFRKVIGVEYCHELSEVARRNLRQASGRARRCEYIEIVERDATEYPIPEEPLVLFFNNPFGSEAMVKLVNNVAASFHRKPRRIVVIYVWPHFAHLWEATGFLHRLRESPAVFDSGPTPPGE